MHGDDARLDDGTWVAVGFDSCSTEADMERTCPECGWSKTSPPESGRPGD